MVLTRCGQGAWLALALVLLGCAVKESEPGVADGPVATPPKVVEEAKVQRDGKYYKDDGPPEVDEVDWRTVPEPEVSFAPISHSYNRPYEVFGVRYVPFDSYVPYSKQGPASWYGRRYHGRKTSSGEVYDMYAMTAAHTILPIPSYARVTRVDDGRSIIVRVNDRGPFLQERVIDLSYTAARKLGVVEAGTVEVVVEAIVPDGNLGTAKNVSLAGFDSADKTTVKLSENSSNYLQLGAFSSLENANSFLESIDLPVTLTVSSMHVVSQDELHRVVVGPYRDKVAAEGDLERLHEAGMEALLKVLE